MKKLISISSNKINKEEVQTINARELHSFLGSKQDFSDWIKKRIKQYNMIENQDFLIKKSKSTGGRQAIEYFISEKFVQLIKEHEECKVRIKLNPIKENASLDTIEQLLGVKLKRQYKVLNYYIDGYDKLNNIAYEIDEDHHKRQSKEDELRQKEIEKVLKCKFVRIKV